MAETRSLSLAQAQNKSKICSVFSNPKRILILWLLAEQEQPVTTISEVIDASLQSTSQHLRLMKSAGVLESRRDGQMIYYRITDGFLAEECGVLRCNEEHYSVEGVYDV